MTQTEDVSEERKRLTTIAMEGDPLVLIDNVERPLGSPVLAAVLTAGYIQDRLLGHNRTVKAHVNATFIATGNNMEFAGDLVRRVVPIDINPGVERPEERRDFRHPRLLDWVAFRRGNSSPRASPSSGRSSPTAALRTPTCRPSAASRPGIPWSVRRSTRRWG
jgi:hypothetical protein